MVLLLFFFQREKSFFHERMRGSVLILNLVLVSGIGCNQNVLTFQITRSNCVSDGDSVLAKVDGIPFQTDYSTPQQMKHLREVMVAEDKLLQEKRKELQH